MAALGTVGILVPVTPWDDLQYRPSPDAEWAFVADRTPFVFRVAGWLEDGHIFYGLHGPVVDGPERYRGLICSIIVHEDGSDWRVQSRSSAAFRVGPNIVVRNHQHDFRHSGGTILSLDVKIWRGDGTRIKRSTRQLSRRQMEADGRIDGQNDRRRRSHVLLRGD